MFPNPSEAFRFFDIKQNGKVTKEHFVFSCNFLHLDHELVEVIELFHIIDYKQDGTIDESEFERIFEGIRGGWNSHEFDIL